LISIKSINCTTTASGSAETETETNVDPSKGIESKNDGAKNQNREKDAATGAHHKDEVHQALNQSQLKH
jgi:hypothetical protein